jgi:hypothetical protein
VVDRDDSPSRIWDSSFLYSNYQSKLNTHSEHHYFPRVAVSTTCAGFTMKLRPRSTPRSGFNQGQHLPRYRWGVGSGSSRTARPHTNWEKGRAAIARRSGITGRAVAIIAMPRRRPPPRKSPRASPFSRSRGRSSSPRSPRPKRHCG